MKRNVFESVQEAQELLRKYRNTLYQSYDAVRKINLLFEDAIEEIPEPPDLDEEQSRALASQLLTLKKMVNPLLFAMQQFPDDDMHKLCGEMLQGKREGEAT